MAQASNSFREVLKRLIENVGSKVEAARILGISRSNLDNFAEGTASPTLTTLEKLAAKLQISVSEIVSDNPPEIRSFEPNARQAIAAIEKLAQAYEALTDSSTPRGRLVAAIAALDDAKIDELFPALSALLRGSRNSNGQGRKGA